MSKTGPITGMTRRGLLGSVAAASAMVSAPAIRSAAAQANRRIVVRDPGGPYTPGFTAAFYEPFKKATGIEVVGVVGQHDPVSYIKSMVEARNYVWDGALLNQASHDVLMDPKTGLFLEEHRSSPGGIPEKYVTPTFMPVLALQTVLAFRSDAFSGKSGPASWADFWNVKDFPGRRSLRKHPQDTLEQALLADGVPADKLYPLDLDRAFKSLDRLKKDVQIWWTGGAQTSQLLKTREVDLCPTWNARAQAAIDEGAPAKIVWNQGLLGTEGFCILKGGPKADLVREFVAFTRDPERQAVYTKYLSYGPVHPDAYKYIDAERAKALPTSPENLKTAIQIDTKYWGEAKDRVLERFNTWLLG
ncbi:ABC transporter substrate-binding protein [Methylobacterium nodulans]|uniref:Extracellular solute-binding protein family 1 n=1 Tax=Methylobacterium nodulans (strain LMG 21967 / CNCM I-2342 / ORS 2060) TaxID=460265 RepID=B8IA77_METNO|nr:ABC transporter substrate-binding protein [Methylobacterium nodulans]ACL59140.1 extracellular solute-binding protein family 1 [Methylobacterium nodulans ORS 2060]